MSERTIIINWKFLGNHQESWDIEELSNCKVICLNFNELDGLDVFNKKNDTFISNKTLILLHTNPPNNGVTIENISIPKALGTVKKYPFCGGEDKVYLTTNNQFGLLFANGSQIDSGANTSVNNISYIKKDYFEFVWDWYWNKLDLEYQKKKLINLWLPLAIDIQGLSEVENGKKNDYLIEVSNELDKIENGKSYAETLIEGWNEVKKVLLPEDGKQVLEDKYQIKDDEIDKVKFPIEKETDTNGNLKKLEVATLKDFVKKNYEDKNNPNFLPNWLQEVVNVIDKKIEESSKLVEEK